MISSKRDYGWSGRLGIGTPQANPTVEAEMRRIIPLGVEYFTLRLISDSDDPRQRLIDYLMKLPSLIKNGYSGLEIQCFLFGCTGSSYLINEVQENEIIRESTEILNGSPIVTAAGALNNWLKSLNAKTIALATPYPEWLYQSAKTYWQNKGYEVIASEQVPIQGVDSYGIYQLESRDAESAVKKLLKLKVDAIIISGTGMPSLNIIKANQQSNIKIMSSNYATAIQGLDILGQTATHPDQWNIKGE